MKFIYAVSRNQPVESMLDQLYDAVALQHGPLGQSVVGFDIVDEEDRCEKRLKFLEFYGD